MERGWKEGREKWRKDRDFWMGWGLLVWLLDHGGMGNEVVVMV